jgi:hypothetical protein
MLPNHALEGGGQCQMLHPSRLPRGSARLRFPAKTEHALKCAELFGVRVRADLSRPLRHQNRSHKIGRWRASWNSSPSTSNRALVHAHQVGASPNSDAPSGPGRGLPASNMRLLILILTSPALRQS